MIKKKKPLFKNKEKNPKINHDTRKQWVASVKINNKLFL